MVIWLKHRLVELLVGAALGFTGWCIFGKRMTSFWFGSLGGSFSCRLDVDAGLDKFVSMQLYSALGGALGVVLLAALVRRLWSKGRARRALPPPVPPVPGAPA
jgi:hypothetical protein